MGAVKNEYAALGMDTGALQNNAILHIGELMLLISLLSGVCTIAVGYFSALVAAGLARDLRRFVFRKVESFSKAEIDKFSTSSLITRSTNDITQIQTTVMMVIRMAFYAPIMGVGAVILALRTSVSMSWMIGLAVLVLIGFIVVIFSITLPKFAIIQKLLDRLNLVTSENLAGMMVIRAFNTQPFEENRFDRANRDVTDTNLFVNRVMAAMLPAMMLIYERADGADHLGRSAPGGPGQHAGGRHDRLHAVCAAGGVCLPVPVVHVHHRAARGRLGRCASPTCWTPSPRFKTRKTPAKLQAGHGRHGRVPPRLVPLSGRRARTCCTT